MVLPTRRKFVGSLSHNQVLSPESSLKDGTISVIQWVRFQNFANSSVFILLPNNYSVDTDAAWRLTIQSTGTSFIWSWNTSASGINITGSFRVPLGRWLCFMSQVIKNADGTLTGRIFINGTLISESTSGVRDQKPLERIRLQSSTSWLTTAKTLVYEREITLQEYSEYYFNSIKPALPKIDWEFEEMAGETLFDTSGNLNNGTIISPIWKTITPSKESIKRANNKASLVFDGVDDSGNVSGVGAFTNVHSLHCRMQVKSFVADHTGILWIGNGIEILLSISRRVEIYGTSFRAVGPRLKIGGWYDVDVTRDGTTTDGYKVYIDGIFVGSTTRPGTSSGTNLVFGSKSGSSYSNVAFKNIIIQNGVVWTPEQIYNLHHFNIIPPGAIVFDMNEGAGTTITSNTGLVGTITGAVWSNEVPSKALPARDGNMIPNGDFSYQPPYIADTTSPTDRIVDGSSSGSSADLNLFNWRTVNASLLGGSITKARFDNVDGLDCIRLETDRLGKSTSNTSLFGVCSIRYPGGTLAEKERKYLISVKPNTEYTVTCKIKIESLLLADRQWFGLSFVQYTGALTRINTIGPDVVGFVTDGFVDIAYTITTNSNTQYLAPFIRWAATGVGDFSGGGGVAYIAKAHLHPVVTVKPVNRGGNMIPNGDFSYQPTSRGFTNGQSRIPDGSESGLSHGTIGFPNQAKKQYRWSINAYNVTNPKVYWEYKSVDSGYSGVGGIVLEGEAVKERVNLTLGQRNFGDLNDKLDITRNLVAVKPNTEYQFTIRYKLDLLQNAVGDPTSYGLEINAIQHSGTGFISHNRIRGGYFMPETIGEFITDTITFTTSASTRYVNPFLSIRGDSTNYADMRLKIDYVDLRPTT